MAHAHMAEMLDLDAEVLHEYHREVITWVSDGLPADARVVDLGAGTGTGTIALARALPSATVVAVDVDDEMLGHVRHRAAALGGRVRTVAADLDVPWPADLGPADLIWASASMHHMADPGFAVAQAFATLRPGGRFAITELDSFPRFLTDPAEVAVEDQGQAAMAARREEGGLHMHENWGDRLTAAGFTLDAERHFDIDLRPPLPAAAARYAQVSIERMRHGLEDRLSAADLAALDKIIADLPARTDLSVRTNRTVWLAHR